MVLMNMAFIVGQKPKLSVKDSIIVFSESVMKIWLSPDNPSAEYAKDLSRFAFFSLFIYEFLSTY